MRVAYCLVGIVGSSNFGMGLGKDIDYRIAHYWNKKNIFDINDEVDVFLHSWSVKHEMGLVDAYKPKKYLFEKQIDFNQETIRDNCIASRWYSTAICNNLRKSYEKEMSIKYDAVMFFRYDHVFLVPLNFSDFDMDYIWMRHGNPIGRIDGVRQQDNLNNGIDTTVVVKLNTIEKRRNHSLVNDRVYDSFIFSKPENIDVYANVYNYYVSTGTKINSPHSEVVEQFKRENLYENLDFCFFGETDTEAVRALYKNPQMIDDEFDLNNFERFEDKYVRQNPNVINRFKYDPNNNENLDVDNVNFKTKIVQ